MADQTNPAGRPVTERTRIPMSTPTRKLEVPPIEGYHLYWFLESNVPRALDGGYEFVKRDEVKLNQHGIATGRGVSGNTDLGTNVSVVAGGVSESGGAERLVLMKIKQEWYDEDRKQLENRNASILEAIFRGEIIPGSEEASREDRNQMYLKTLPSSKPLLQRQRRK